jgi:hypothetical protein
MAHSPRLLGYTAHSEAPQLLDSCQYHQRSSKDLILPLASETRFPPCKTGGSWTLWTVRADCTLIVALQSSILTSRLRTPPATSQRDVNSAWLEFI